MGIAAVAAAATVVSAGASIAGGIAANKAAKKEASALNDQAAVTQVEAQAEAERRAIEIRKFEGKQKLAFLKNGVTLEGSPLLVLDETMREGQKEVDSIMRQGNAQANYARQNAAITRNKGRAALIGGIGNAAGSLINGYGIADQAGLFNSNQPTATFSQRFARDSMVSRQ